MILSKNNRLEWHEDIKMPLNGLKDQGKDVADYRASLPRTGCRVYRKRDRPVERRHVTHLRYQFSFFIFMVQVILVAHFELKFKEVSIISSSRFNEKLQ